MMPLTMVNTGEPNVIKKVGGKEETRRFLEKLGFVPGGTVTVVSEIEGNLIVNVKRFQSCHWQRYGQQDYGLMKNAISGKKSENRKGRQR